MSSEDTPAVPFPATRAEYYAQRKKERLADLVQRQASKAIDKAGALWPGSEEAARETILRSMEAWQRASPWHPGTKEQVASHEAGHFIAFQAVGFGAASAEIVGSSGGIGGWTGSAGHCDPPIYDFLGRWPISDGHVLADAVSILAGPAAEHFMGGGDFHSSSGETIQVCLLARKLAEIKGVEWRVVMVDVLKCTAALIERYEPVIRGVADVLGRHRRITYFDKRIEKLLGRVSPSFLTEPWPGKPKRLCELAKLFTQAPIDLPALMRRIAP